jgi:predicted nucleic acid-binding protein
MSGKFLLDTNVLISALNKELIFPKNDYFISIITEIELLSFPKLSETEEFILREFLKNFEIQNINQDIKEKAIEIRRKSFLKLPDSLIIATAVYLNAILVTADKQILKYKNFVKMIDFNDIEIENRKVKF